MDSITRPLHLVLAADLDGTIGVDGRLPWHLPDDLRRFKQLTLGQTVLMGRKTWDSLGRPLPQRDNWVLSRDPVFAPPGARVFSSLDAALQQPGDGPLMVIGGGELFAQLLDRAERVYLTRVLARIGGDAHFPLAVLDSLRVEASSHHEADSKHAHAFDFIDYRR